METTTYKGYQIEVFQLTDKKFTVSINKGDDYYSEDWNGGSIEGVMSLAMDFVDHLEK